jgi:hypothetical protein
MREPSGDAVIASACPFRLGANEGIRMPVRMS